IADALSTAFAYDTRLLVEKRIQGREITVAVLDRDFPIALPTIEITTPEGSWYDYDHRYTKGLSEHRIPPGISEAQRRRWEEVALAAHAALGCRDLSRVDLIAPEHGDPILLELNTMPGMTPTSLYPDAAKAAGISFDELMVLFIERASARACASDDCPRSLG